MPFFCTVHVIHMPRFHVSNIENMAEISLGHDTKMTENLTLCFTVVIPFCKQAETVSCSTIKMYVT